MDNDNNNSNLVPQNTKGAKTDTSFSETYTTIEEAISGYESAKQKLLDISKWHDYAGEGTADFQLTDITGNIVYRSATEGDYFKIDIPGPGSKTGEGYDWVQIQSIIEKTENDCQYISITVRPASNPTNQNEDVAHFFKDEASSTFMIQRTGLVVSAEVHGRNEQANTDSQNIIDKVRNIIVAAGAFLGLSEVQWKSLVKGLLSS
ncbi:hypothetical protein WG906_00525 [Pedobacter sp. P351]|uniref:hypothetical protein n=1 Tax=Pedobacter superstes TaxID=3133441 RepID=UPI0030A89759